MIVYHKDHRITIKPIERDWSEDAYSIHITGPKVELKDEAEGTEQSIRWAKQEIDKKVM